MKVSKYKNTVQCQVPIEVLRWLNVMPGDEVAFDCEGNAVTLYVKSRKPLDDIRKYKKKRL